jgi:hypothetical protein
MLGMLRVRLLMVLWPLLGLGMLGVLLQLLLVPARLTLLLEGVLLWMLLMAQLRLLLAPQWTKGAELQMAGLEWGAQ